jgi:sugar lactone lactonase YvrE
MRNRGVVAIITLLSWTMIGHAVTPQFWEHFSQEELLEGNLNGVSLSQDGKLFPAPAYDLVYATGQSFIFSMVRDALGNLYIGTGDEGKVFKIDPQGKGSLFFQAKELNIFAMALDAAGSLYVGTSPDGKIYKVDGSGRSEVFCDLESKYIWTMIFDNAGNLYVGTGSSGIIYKIEKDGKKAIFYTCSDTHVRSLLWNNKNLLAGTAPGGLVLEINPEGRGFALLDTPLEEVHSLAVDRSGTIYAAAASSKSAASKIPAKSTLGASENSSSDVVVTVIASVGATTGKVEETKAAGLAGEKASFAYKTAVYAIARDGSVETLYESGEQMVFDLLAREDGTLLIATGPKGRLLEIGTDRKVTILTDSSEEDSTRLLAADGVVYVGSSNQGKVYRLQPQKAQSGTYESKALDAKTVSSWGKIFWNAVNQGNSLVEISTRTGNTEKANNLWSEWSAPYKFSGQPINSPRARYLQWRAIFKQAAGAESKAPAGVLDRVQIAYLQQNVRPQVTELTVLPYGIELLKQPSLAASGGTIVVSSATSAGRSVNAPREHGREQDSMPPKQSLQPGAQSFTWKASDDNEDILEYSLYFKGEQDSDWKLLEKNLSDTFYTLNAASLPDGVYRLKVVANDAFSNPYDKFLIGERISDPFVMVNTTPRVEIAGNKVTGRKVNIQFRASTQIGCIATAEFSIDGGEWHLVFPNDGIADSAEEEYNVVTPDLFQGEHMIGIRAGDRNGTTGTARLIVKVP